MRAPLQRIIRLWAIAGGLILLAIVGATVLNVGSYLFDAVAGLFGRNFPILPGYEDFVRLTVSAAVPMLFPLCQLRGGHVAVDIFVEMLPRRMVRVVDTLSMAMMTALALFLFYWMIFGAIETYHDGVVSHMLGWHEWPFYLPGIVSLLLWAAAAFYSTKDCLLGRPSG